MAKSLDLTGQIFERLTAICPDGKDSQGLIKWKFSCICGNFISVAGSQVKKGNTKSCGCLAKEKLIVNNKKLKVKHGQSDHRLYHVWSKMNDRCNSPLDKRYDDYGGRGITVCDRWLKGQEDEQGLLNFINDMFETYSEGLTIERTNNDKGYSFDNCEWVTPSVQSYNRRKRKNTSSKFIGVSFIAARSKWAAYCGKKYLGLFDSEDVAMQFREEYIIENNLPNRRNT